MILIVDDSEGRSVAPRTRESSGRPVLNVVSAEEAPGLTTGDPGALVVDYELPSINGLALLRRPGRVRGRLDARRFDWKSIDLMGRHVWPVRAVARGTHGGHGPVGVWDLVPRMDPAP